MEPVQNWVHKINCEALKIWSAKSAIYLIETQKVGAQIRTLAQKGPPSLPCMFVSGVAELGAVSVLLSPHYLANK